MTIAKTLNCDAHYNLGVFDSQITLRAFSHLAQTLESTPRCDSGFSWRRGSFKFWFHTLIVSTGLIVHYVNSALLGLQTLLVLDLRIFIISLWHQHYALYGGRFFPCRLACGVQVCEVLTSMLS